MSRVNCFSIAKIKIFVCITTGLATANAAGVVLENRRLRLSFDSTTGMISGMVNKGTHQTLPVREEGFLVEAEEFLLSSPQMKLRSLEKISPEQVDAVYSAGERTVRSSYSLGKDHHFFEKTLSVRSPSAFSWKSVVVGKISLPGNGNLTWVRYPHQKMITYFGRSSRSGIFLGLEKAFDNSSVRDGVVTLGYPVSLKVDANQAIETEKLYVGAYRRGYQEQAEPNLPLQSESDAMVAMTRAMLGPPRHGFVPMACGWWSEMEHNAYRDAKSVQADMRSIDFLRELGIDWVSDSHPWGGETEMMNHLRLTDGYKPMPLVSQLYEYAKAAGVKMVFWPTMNNTHPWWKAEGRAFLSDRKDWLMYPELRTLQGEMLSGIKFKEAVQGNCIANRPFREWINRLSIDGMRTGYFPGWAMDGDFFGGGGIVTPVDCPRSDHDHLAGDSTYACERALTQLVTNVRKFEPQTYIFVCRPPMDMGVFYQRNVDAVFTIDEMAKPVSLPGLHDQPINVMLGDKIRKWSRVRVHHHFFPHYIDQPQVFVGPKSIGKAGLDWPSKAIDYIILSAISSSPNQLYYLPTKAGMPTEDKRTIRKWMEWGRKNEAYLLVRKDLPDWPGAGKVDGSAHIVGNRGFIFLFNPNPQALDGSFVLDESIGLKQGTRYRISSVYPNVSRGKPVQRGHKVLWKVPAQTATILEVLPE